MEKEKVFVKGENNHAEENHSDRLKSRLSSGLMIFATLATLSPFTKNTEAQKPDYTPPHPLRQTERLQPVNQEEQPTLVIPQKEQTQTTVQERKEFSHIEETDPFSQEGKLEKFIAGYALMSKEEQKKIEKQVITDESGTTIFFSKRTFDRINPSSNPLLGMKDQSFSSIALPAESKENDPLESYIQKLYLLSDLSLGKESLIIIDDSTPNKENQNIIVWSYNEQERRFNQTCTISLYHNDALFSLPSALSLLSNPPLRTVLAPFAIRPSWDDKNNQLVYADEVKIFAEFNLKELDYQTNTVKSITRETPTLLGDVHSRLKANLKRYLKLTEPWKPLTVFFTHPEEIQKYIGSDDISELKHIKLLPNADNPVFFVPMSGTFGFHNIKVLDVLKKSVQKLYDIDPSILTMFNQWGVNTILPKGGGDFIGSIRMNESNDVTSLNIPPYYLHILETRGQKEYEQFVESQIEELKNSHLNVALSQGYMDYFLHKLIIQRELFGLNVRQYNSACDVRAKLVATSKFIEHFAKKYQSKIDSTFYNNLIENAHNALSIAQSLMNRK